MLKTQHSPIPPGSEKHHYHILDGLRGVAAIVVVWFHIFEAYATSHVDQIINHGYLSVDFFSCCPASSSDMPMTTAGKK